MACVAPLQTGNQLFMQFMSEVWELYAFKMFLKKSLMLIKAAFMCSKTETNANVVK